MWKAGLIFIAVYIGFVLTRRLRPIVAWAGIAAAIIIGALKPYEIITGIHWNILFIFIGSLVLAELFVVSRVPERISDILINISPNLGLAFLFIIVFTSVLSAFIENVATVLIVAPVAIELAKKAGVSPVPVIIGLAVSSNLQGTATLIGDPPSMILAATMHMNFLDFFWYKGNAGIFFFVELGALAGFAFLYFLFRKNLHRPEPIPLAEVTSWVPVWFLAAMIVLLSLASLVDPDFVWFGGAVCAGIAVIGLVWFWRRETGEMRGFLRRLDWSTAAFLAGVFVLITMLEERGTITALVDRLGALAGANGFLVYTVIVWFSVFVSAFIDNVPYITAVLPVVLGLSGELGLPREALAFGVLIGSCLGGNITPIGASANIVAVGILNKEEHPISFRGFFKIGFPFTVAATGVAYITLWLAYR
jgi:Na+/H+ antiporter NhaD/arsenite permease-like protein